MSQNLADAVAAGTGISLVLMVLAVGLLVHYPPALPYYILLGVGTAGFIYGVTRLWRDRRS